MSEPTRKRPAETDSERAEKRTRRCALVKIISGGQTGADRAGLEAAHELGLETGGFVPHGCMTSAGPDIELRTKYHLEELPIGPIKATYPRRSMLNVDRADATVAFRLKASPGTDRTIQYCRTAKWAKKTTNDAPVSIFRPVFVVSRFDAATEKALREWIVEFNVATLNVSGHREYRLPSSRSFKDAVREFLVRALRPLISQHAGETRED